MRLLYETLTDIPVGFTEVEYLESTGTQYIDTGLNYFADFEISIQLRNNVSNKALGNGANCCMQRLNSNNPYWYFSTGSGASNSYTSSTLITEHHVMKWKDNKIYSDDVLLTNFTKNLNTPNRMYLYSADGSNNYPNVIYFCKLWNPTTGELVRDFVPCLDRNNVPCMYDKVEGKAYYNEGTGSFTYGRKIIPVEYIESTGTQYIDTGFNPTSKTRWEYDYQFNNTPSSYIGNGMFITSPSTQRFAIGLIGASFNMSYGADNVVPVASDTNRHNFIIDAKNMYWQIDNSTGTYATTVTATLSRSIYFFARNGGSLYNPHSGKLFGSKIYDNDVLVRDYLPAIDENGVGYMFDKVTHSLYANMGTGAFIVGDELPKKKLRFLKTSNRRLPLGYKEVEYLESTGTQYIDTGIFGNVNTKIDIAFSKKNLPTNIYGIVGARGSTVNTNNISVVYSGTGMSLDFNNSAYATYRYPEYNSLEDTKYRAILDRNERSLYKDDILVGQNTTTCNDTISTTSFWMFKLENFYGAEAKIYYCKLWDNDTLVRDFIPCLDNNNVPCMYDRVSGQTFYNQGSGTFIVGDEIRQDTTRFLM